MAGSIRERFSPLFSVHGMAFSAVSGTGGVLLDVCESTNKQRTQQDYLHRAAILDRDPRGGGMALIFATEMAGLK